MPGSSRTARSRSADFTAICAKTEEGSPAVTGWGERCGPLVKMVHSSIEYGDMQLISRGLL